MSLRDAKHATAESIQRNAERVLELSKENEELRLKLKQSDRKLELESLIKGHMEAMRPLLDEWSALK